MLAMPGWPKRKSWIQGVGFFIVEDAGLRQFTRAGNFQLNQSQQLVTINGELVQGWIRDDSGNIDTNLPIGDITLQGQSTINPTATSEISIRGNLQAGSVSSFSRPIQVFDALGESHILTMLFTPVAARAGASSSFDVSVLMPAEDMILEGSGPPPTPPLADVDLVAGGPLPIDFDNSGTLIVPAIPYEVSLDMAAVVPAVEYTNGAADLLVTWDLLDDLDQPTLSSFGAPSAITEIFQNGSAAAELVSISIADGGRISGLFSDGRSLALAQIALARFPNAQSLLAVGNNNFSWVST